MRCCIRRRSEPSGLKRVSSSRCKAASGRRERSREGLPVIQQGNWENEGRKQPLFRRKVTRTAPLGRRVRKNAWGKAQSRKTSNRSTPRSVYTAGSQFVIVRVASFGTEIGMVTLQHFTKNFVITRNEQVVAGFGMRNNFLRQRRGERQVGRATRKPVPAMEPGETFNRRLGESARSSSTFTLSMKIFKAAFVAP